MVQPLGSEFPMEGMIGPNSELGRISAKTSMFNAKEGKGYEKLLNALRQAEAELAPNLRTNVRSVLPPGATISSVAGKIAGKYIPIAGAGLSLLQGDVGGAAGGLLGMGAGTLVSPLLGPLAPLAPLVGSVVGGGIGTAAQKGIGGLVQSALGNASANTAARGESAGPIPGLPGIGAKEVGGMDANRMLELVRAANTGRIEAAQALNPMLNQNLDQQRNRQMQLNQQTAQLTGGLNQQRYMAELAGGAQSETGALTRQILTTTNPYANSAFQYR